MDMISLLKKIILLRHEKLLHPFIIIAESKNKILALQCSSVEYDDEHNEYSFFHGDYYKNKINKNSFIIDLDVNDGLKYHSETDLNMIYSINKECLNSKNIKNIINHNKYLEILQYYNDSFNQCDIFFSKEIDEMLRKSININY